MASSANTSISLELATKQQNAETMFVVLLVACFLGLPTLVGLASAWHAWQRRRRKVNKLGRRQALARGDSTRARLQIYLYSKTRLGLMWDVLQAALAITSCALYIKSTYEPDCVQVSVAVDLLTELVIFAFFLADYVLSFYLARDKLTFVLSPVALADLLTILPTLLQIALSSIGVDQTGCGESSFIFAKFVRLIRIMRVMRMIRVLRLGSHLSASGGDNVVHHILAVATTLTTVVFVAACVFQWVETSTDDSVQIYLPFHKALYMMIIEVLGRSVHTHCKAESEHPLQAGSACCTLPPLSLPPTHLALAFPHLLSQASHPRPHRLGLLRRVDGRGGRHHDCPLAAGAACGCAPPRLHLQATGLLAAVG